MQVDRSQQRAITRLCIQCGLFLLQHGAESALVEELSTRLGRALGMDSVESAISSNAILLVIMVGLSCACFCKLNNGGWDGALVSFCASTVAMYIRQVLTHRSMHPQINFCITAFVATTISGLLLRLPAFASTPTIAMAASVLLLVPGFPLINAVADMFKGHINTGLARWAIASLLTLATCIGVVMAMTVWGLRGWA